MKIFSANQNKFLHHLISAFALPIFFISISCKAIAQKHHVENPRLYFLHDPAVSSASQAEEIDPAQVDIAGKTISNSSEDENFFMPAPANDACATATAAANVLTPGGNYKCGTTQGGSIEAGEYTGCFVPAPVSTVWYSFIANQPTMWVCIKPNGAAICTGAASSFGVAVYQTNTCFPNAPAGCLNYFSATATNVFSKLNLVGLSPGSQYFVQVATYASCAGNTWKPFCIKIGNPATCTTCATNCGPMCIWAGPNPPLPADITSTCPAYGWAPPMNLGDAQTNCFSFTAANDTVWLQQIVYSYCSPNTLSFTYDLYDGVCGLIQSGNVFVNNQITGLSVGTVYKICYTLTAACSWDSVFWPYAYTTSTVLPVELVSFGAMPYKDKIKIYWATASEENAKEFIVERTHNAIDFTEVAHTNASGNSTSMLNYKAYDDHPQQGANYYRLKQVDFNGKFTYTKLVSAKFYSSIVDLIIIPNPAKDKATIRFNATGNYSALLRITGMQGKTILNRQFISEEGINEYSLNMNELVTGIYSVQLIVDDQNMISKIVKE
jgi:Secretion system C-terminal sorting domain